MEVIDDSKKDPNVESTDDDKNRSPEESQTILTESKKDNSKDGSKNDSTNSTIDVKKNSTEESKTPIMEVFDGSQNNTHVESTDDDKNRSPEENQTILTEPKKDNSNDDSKN